MKFELVDSLSLPGHREKANEDAFGYRDCAAVVLDGATGLGERLLPGPSDAAWLARFGANRIMAYIADGASVQEAVTAALFDAETSFASLRRRAPSERYEIPYASLMLANASGGAVEFAWYGDCAALIARPGEKTEIVGDALDKRAREATRVRSLAQSKGETAASASVREIYLPALRAARNMVNTDAGGYLFGPDVTAADHLRTQICALPAGTHLLLVTDGFLALVSDYAHCDADTLVRDALCEGLEALTDKLREIEDADPDGKAFPRFKQSDDATAVLVRVV